MGLTNTEVDPAMRCPACGSDNITREKYSRLLLALSMLLAGVPLAFIKGKYRCFDCYEKWNADER